MQKVRIFRNTQARLIYEIERQKEEIAGLYAQIGRDRITNLATSQRCQKFTREAWNRIVRGKRDSPISVALFEIDLFREFCDLNGPLAGDRVLKTTARILRGGLDSVGDWAARYGTEGKFALVLPNVGGQAAVEEAQAIQTDFADVQVPFALSPSGSVTVSAGIATVVPCRHVAPPDLFESAQVALLAAQLQGFNRIQLFEMPCHHLRCDLH